MLSDWERSEKEHERKKLKAQQHKLKLLTELENMIKKDLEYDSGNEKYAKTSHERIKQKRKREQEKDEEDRLKEFEEIRAEEQRLKEEEEKRLEEERKALERLKRPKSRFTEIKDNKALQNQEKKQDSEIDNKQQVSIQFLNLKQENIDSPDANMVSEDNEDKAISKDYYIPQNVPVGAIPLRLPIQAVKVEMKAPNSIAAELSQTEYKERDQSKGSELEHRPSKFSEQSVPDNIQKPKLFSENEIGSMPLQAPAPIVNVLNQGSEDEEKALEKLQKNVSNSALSERLVQIEEMRKQNEIKQLEEKKSMEISSINLVDKEQVVKKLKELYFSIPKKPEGLFDYPLNWDILISFNVIDIVMQRIITKRVKEILNVEEPHFIRFLVDLLKKKPTPQYLNQNLSKVLDEATEGFVISIWRALVFENKKYEAGILTERLKR